MALVTPQYPVLQRKNQGLVLVEQRDQTGNKELRRIDSVQLMPVINAPSPIAELASVMDAATGAALDMNPFVVRADQATAQTFLDHNVVRIPNLLTREQADRVYQTVEQSYINAGGRNPIGQVLTEYGISQRITQWIEQMPGTRLEYWDGRHYKATSIAKDPEISDRMGSRKFFVILIGGNRPISLQNKTTKVTIKLNNAEGDLLYFSDQTLQYYMVKTGANARDKRTHYRIIYVMRANTAAHIPLVDDDDEVGAPPLPPIPLPILVNDIPRPIQPVQPEPTVNFGNNDMTDEQLMLIEEYFGLMTLDDRVSIARRQQLREALRTRGIDVQ